MNQLTRLTASLDRALDHAQTYETKGRVLQVVGTVIRATVPAVRIGELCYLQNPFEDYRLPAEVIGFAKQDALLTPLGGLEGLSTDAQVIPTGRCHRVAVGPQLLGRVLDGLGRPLERDRFGDLDTETTYPVYAPPPNPLKRRVIDRPLGLGVRAIDGLLTCGEGQRMGIFAAAGGGKSTLLGMMVQGADVDVNVIALIGERGREVREFIERDLGAKGLAKSVVVVATSDKSSMERLRAAHVATAIAEYFRDQGKRVLLLMDSITRFARAQRELGLAAGEPPARRGFPPSVFTALPKLMERAGQSDRGSITALYTVLVEGDDMTEPIADESRSILDGHIVLSRDLAAANHFPAIDVLASASRVMRAVVDSDHLQAAGMIRQHLAKFRDIELLVQIGEYRKGSDEQADQALMAMPRIRAFLQQAIDQESSFSETFDHLCRTAR